MQEKLNFLLGSLKCPGEEYAERNGHPLFAAISQLQMVMNILGDLTPVSASMAVSTDKITVEAKLKCPDDRLVLITQTFMMHSFAVCRVS